MDSRVGDQILGGHVRINPHKNREWPLFRAALCTSKALTPLTLVTARAILPLVVVLPLAEVPSQAAPKLGLVQRNTNQKTIK